MKTIAVIDDDIYIGNLLEKLLGDEGYRVLRAYSGTEALYLLERNKPDLILLDLMLPGLSGEELLSRIKGIPIIVLSAKADVQDKVNVLMSGAADYMTKPFESAELLARIAVQLRSGGAKDAVLSYDELELHPVSHQLLVKGSQVHLTRTEYAVLKLLMERPGQVIAKSSILEGIFEDTPDCTESSLKIHVSNLRKKLRDASGKDYIEAVWGIGFRLN